MNTANEKAQQQAPERQIAGAVASRINSRLIYMAIAALVFVLLCSAPFVIGYVWLNRDTGTIETLAPVIYAAEPVQVPTPTQLGYSNETEAQNNCYAPRYVAPIYRSGQIVGWSCELSLD